MTYHLSMPYDEISWYIKVSSCNWEMRSPLLWFALWIFALGNLATRREVSIWPSRKKSYLVAATVHFWLVHTVRPKRYTVWLCCFPSHLTLSRPARTHRTKYLNNSSSNWSLFWFYWTDHHVFFPFFFYPRFFKVTIFDHSWDPCLFN